MRILCWFGYHAFGPWMAKGTTGWLIARICRRCYKQEITALGYQA